MRSPNDTAADPLRRPSRTLAGTTSPFLPPRFATTTANFRPRLGVVRPEARIGLLHQQVLVHHPDLRLDTPDRFVEVNLPDDLTGHIVNINLHRSIPHA
jgi:hypothetical protein